MVSSLDARAERARQGSRRQRDQAALADLERDRRSARDAERLAKATPTQQATNAWITARDSVDIAPSQHAIWLLPLTAVGELDGAVVCSGPPDVIARLRGTGYGARLGEAVRASSDYSGVYLCESP